MEQPKEQPSKPSPEASETAPQEVWKQPASKPAVAFSGGFTSWVDYKHLSETLPRKHDGSSLFPDYSKRKPDTTDKRIAQIRADHKARWSHTFNPDLQFELQDLLALIDELQQRIGQSFHLLDEPHDM